jgi:hypothetical protein
MTDIQRPNEADGSSPLAATVKGLSLFGTVAWAFTLFAFVAALNAPTAGGWNALGPFVVLFVTTPLFVAFVLPALLFSFLGGLPGAKVGAGFLAAGMLTACAFFAGPILRTML